MFIGCMGRTLSLDQIKEHTSAHGQLYTEFGHETNALTFILILHLTGHRGCILAMTTPRLS